MASKITENSTLAARYAKAFFDICKGHNAVDSSLSELKTFEDAKTNIAELNDFVANPAISKQQIAKSILEICKQLNFSTEVTDFIAFTIASRRGNLISEIVEKFSQLRDSESGTSRAIVYSAKPISEKLLLDISNSLSSKLNLKIESENRIDQSLIGGLKIQIGSKVIDDSVSEKLNKLKISLQN